MVKKNVKENMNQLPECAAEFIKNIIKKMRYRRKVRQDVEAELTTHFEDELQVCKTEKERQEKAQHLIEEFGDIKLLAILIRRAKKRCRPPWVIMAVRCLQAFSISLVFLLFYIIWFFTGKPVVTKDYVTEMNKLVKLNEDETLNAAYFYSEAAKIWFEDSNDEKSYPIMDNSYEATFEEKKLIKKWINHNEKYIELFVQGTQKPYYWILFETNKYTKDEGVFYLNIPYLTPMRQVIMSLYWRAMIRVEEGDTIGGLSDIRSCYHVKSQLKTSTSTLEYLIGTSYGYMVNRVLRMIINNNKIDSKILADFQNDFENIIKNENLRINYSGEKIFILDEIQRGFTSGRIGKGHLYLPELQKLLNLDTFRGSPVEPGRFELFYHLLFKHPNRNQTLKTLGKLYEYWDKVALMTPSQVNNQHDSLEKEHKEIINGNWFLLLLTPLNEFFISRGYQDKADTQATLIIIALTRYRQDIGRYPDNLDELVEAGYLKKMPIDPFSDKPYVYRQTDDDFILYSYGLNCKDDGSKIYRNRSGIYEMFSEKDSDAVFWPVIEQKKESGDKI